MPGTGGYDSLPAVAVTIDQVIAWNMRHWRRIAGMTQEELGGAVGLSPANISAAERSVSSDRERRRFDGQTAASVAAALGLPVIALYLPPEDDGIGRRYVWHAGFDPEPRSMAELMWLAMHDNNSDSPAMKAYRDRLQSAATAYVDKYWGGEVADWFRHIDSAEMRADRAARLRSSRDMLLSAAATMGQLAEDLERPEEAV